MTPRAPRAPRRLSAEKRRQQLVEIALDRIAEHGFDEYSLDEVAEVADVSRNLLYRYFPRGRQDLSLAVVERVMAELAERWNVDPTLDRRERAEINLGRFARHGFDATAEWRVYRRVRAVTDREAVAIIDEFHSQWAERIAANNDVEPSNEIIATALRALIAFACEAIDQAATRGITEQDVMELIFGVFDDTLASCGRVETTRSPKRRTRSHSNR
jgi:AcrR family transcriptional regulator